jgi:hypothetical protein
MLEEIESIEISETVFRLANAPQLRAALEQLGGDLRDINETIDFLQAAPTDQVSLLLIAGPFAAPSASFVPSPTRFSDGTWRVFYSALEPETCEKEVGEWCRRTLQSLPPASQRFYYRELRCSLNGRGYDLRPMKEPWLFLTGGVDTYPECQELAREARMRGAQAMLCPSARRDAGTTSPVFVQQVLSNGAVLGVVAILIDQDGTISAVRS